MSQGRALVVVLAMDAAERAEIVLRLEVEGHRGIGAANAAEAAALLREESPEAAVVDLRVPGAREILAAAGRLRPEVTLVALVAGPGDCLRALQDGADQVLPAPAQPEAVALLARRLAANRALQRENGALRRALWAGRGFGALVGESPAMRRALDLASAAARSGGHVLIAGEPGAGKHAVARAIHAGSARAAGPFERVPCELEEAVLAAVLFGSAGAGVGPGALAAAAGGTLFLEEVCALPPGLLEKLAAALDPGGPAAGGVRVVAATGRDLRAGSAEGRFRQDLLGRPGTVALRVPPLRERREDVPLLVRVFLETISAELRRPVPRLTAEALELLLAHPWPGNVVELRRAVERAALTAEGGVIEAARLGLAAAGAAPRAGAVPLTLHDLERRHIAEVLAHTGGNVSQAARLLSIDRVTLYNKMRRYGIRKEALHRG